MARPRSNSVYLSDAISRYLRERSDEIAPATLKLTRIALTKMRRALCDGCRPAPAGQGDGAPDRKLDAIDHEAAAVWVHEGQYTSVGGERVAVSPNTWRLYLSMSEQFFTWAQVQGLYPDGKRPTQGFRKPKAAQRPFTRVSIANFLDLLDSAPNAWVRWFAVGGAYFGARFDSEISGLTVADARAYLEAEEFTLVRPKTGTVSTVYVTRDLQRETRTWLAWYEARVRLMYNRPLAEQDRLFPANRVGKQALDGLPSVMPDRSPGQPYEVVQRLLRANGLPTRQEGMHTFRRSMLRSLYEDLIMRSRLPEGDPNRYESNVEPIEVCRVFAGHKDVAQTRKYIGVELGQDAARDVLKGQEMFPTHTSEHVARTEEALSRASKVRHLRAV